MSAPRIFISIAAFCDPVLPFTLLQARLNAKFPENLHFGVIDQSPADQPSPTAEQAAPARLSCIKIDPLQARGVCWARAMAMTLWDGEDWFLQIDSHMDFAAHWDVQLIAQAQALQAQGTRDVVISSYPQPFHFDARGLPVHHSLSPGSVLVHTVAPEAQFAPDHPQLAFWAHPINSRVPVRGYHLGAGCLFAPGHYAQRFPYDPFYYFMGEEQALALRLFTHGWDLWHTPDLPIYHLYNDGRADQPKRPLHTDPVFEAQRKETWSQREARARLRLIALIMEEDLGIYGLGSVRSLADYTRFSGINYESLEIEARAYRPTGRAV